MRFDRSKHGARCQTCPLRYRHRVWALGPDIVNKSWGGVVLCGEGPGADEDREGLPFVGPAGQQLDRQVRAAGLARERIWLTNLLGCRPPDNKLDNPEAQEALAHCSPGLEAELDFLDKHGAKVYVPLGSAPLHALGVEGGITTRRGYVYERAGRTVLGTYHPSYLLRGNFGEIPTSIGDLRKARRLAFDGWQAPAPKMTLFPTLAQVKAFTERVCKAKKPLALDIETTSLIPERGEIVVVGLAESQKSAFSIPLLKQYGKPYWSSVQRKQVLVCLKRILKTCPITVHNAMFDPLYLAEKRLEITHLEHDTMQLHHTIHPELPHRLSYVASVYASIPYWKNTLEDKEGATLSLEDKAFRTYNLWDVIAPAMSLPGLIDDAEALGLYKYYKDRVMPLVDPVLEMTRTGILLDRDAQVSWEASLGKKLREQEAELRGAFSLPETFNLNSTEHLGFLLFNAVPDQLLRAKEDYEARCVEISVLEKELAALKKRQASLSKAETKKLVSLTGQIQRKKSFKVFTTAGARTEMLRGLKPLRLPTGVRTRENKKGYSLDDEAILSLKTSIHNRLLVLDRMTRPPKTAGAEKEGLTQTNKFLQSLIEYRETAKLLSTYGDFETWSDARVHFPFKMHGTATGRLSSGDKKSLGVGNGQNIPPAARKLFIATPGCVLLGADYSSLEPRVLAYIAEDDVAIKDFAEGIKPYDAIIIKVMGIDKSHELWEITRNGIKTYYLGTNYGGGLESVYRQILVKEPDFPMSLAQLREVHEARMARHPAYAAWVQRTKETVLTTRVLTNFAGRRRVFLGSKSEIVRQALDFGPQSGAAEVINRAMVSLWRDLRKRGMKTKLVLQIHDALYLEAPWEERKLAAKLLVKHMEAPIDIGKYKKVIFPVELSAGENWGEMKKTKLEELA